EARWHVTLAFLGDVAADAVPALTAALAARPLGSPLRLRLHRGGAYPNTRRPRVFWAGVEDDADALAPLARAVGAAARTVVKSLDDRPFRGHITVARARRPFHGGPAIVESLNAVVGPPFDATEVVLLRSHLGPTPRYEPLAVFPLTASPD
ncbi:MAG: RNA 2',3'-cyclic phosphodiesterase, partial [Mycobacteriales bacterium]